MELGLLQELPERFRVLFPVLAVDDDDRVLGLDLVDEFLGNKLEIAEYDNALGVDEFNQFEEFFLWLRWCPSAWRHVEQLVVLVSIRRDEQDGLLGSVLREFGEEP